MVIKANNIPWLLSMNSILNDIQLTTDMLFRTVNVCINLINSPLFKKYIIYTLYIFFIVHVLVYFFQHKTLATKLNDDG